MTNFSNHNVTRREWGVWGQIVQQVRVDNESVSLSHDLDFGRDLSLNRRPLSLSLSCVISLSVISAGSPHWGDSSTMELPSIREILRIVLTKCCSSYFHALCELLTGKCASNQSSSVVRQNKVLLLNSRPIPRLNRVWMSATSRQSVCVYNHIVAVGIIFLIRVYLCKNMTYVN